MILINEVDKLKIFLTILFTYILLAFGYNSANEKEFPELRVHYILATAFMSGLLFLLYKL